MMHRIKLPPKGFTPGRDDQDEPVTITRLEVATGQQHEFSTEIFVRGRFMLEGAETRFSGMTVVREGRDDPDYDLDAGGGDEKDAERLALAIHLCLDHCDEGPGPDRFSVSSELARICDGDGDED